MKVCFLKNIINFQNKLLNTKIPATTHKIDNSQNEYDFKMNNFYKHSNAIKNYSIPFLGKINSSTKPQEIYAVDAYGNYTKFPSIEEAAAATNTDQKDIIKCISGKIDYVKDYTFASSNDIEVRTRQGKQPDTILINLMVDIIKSSHSSKKELKPLPGKNAVQITQEKSSDDLPKEKQYSLKNIPKEVLSEKMKERYSKSAFYIMDSRGKYKRFFSQAHVAKALDEDHRVIYKCLNGKQRSTHGFVFAYAHEIESKDENGETVLKLDILKNKLKKDTVIYSVDMAGRYKKFNSADEVIDKLKVSKASLLHCLLGKQDATSGYAFFRAKDIEIQQPDGTVLIDKEKIDEAKLKITSRAFYAIDKNGNYTRYTSQAKATQALGISRSSIYGCLTGRRKTAGGYIFLPADEVEKFDKNGACAVSINRINQALKDLAEPAEAIDIRENGFYAINKDGKCEKFYSIKSAGKELGVHLTSISDCLKGSKKYASGYIYIRAEEIENKDKDGNIKLDKTKIAQKLAVFNGQPFYAIDENGKCTRFNNQTEASKALKDVTVNTISKCLSGKAKGTAGYVFVYADKLVLEETQDNIKFDPTIISEARSYLNRHALYAIDKDGNYTRFANREEAVNILGINIKTLSGCLAGNSKTAKGYTFIAANKVESYLEDGAISADEAKIKSMLDMFK